MSCTVQYTIKDTTLYTIKGINMGAISTPLRWLFRTIFISALILVVAVPVGFMVFFDPNDFKPELSQTLSKQTGFNVEIKGDLSHQFWPNLGFTANDISVADHNQAVGSVKHIHLSLPLTALIRGDITINKIRCDGLSLKLTQAQLGNITENKNSTSNATEASMTPSNKKDFRFAVNAINISNSDIQFSDQANDIHYHARNINLKGQDFMTLAAPIEGGLSLSFRDKKQNQQWQTDIATQGELDLRQLGKIQFQTQNTRINWQQGAQAWDFLLGAKLLFTPNALEASDVSIQSKDSRLTGWITVPWQADKTKTFALHSKKLVLNQFVNLATAEFRDEPQGHIALVASKPSAELLKGNVQIDHLIADKLDIHNLKTSVSMTQNRWHLPQLTANLYQGSLKANVAGEMNANAPIKTQGSLSGVNAQAMLSDLKGIKQLSGTVSSNFDLLLHPKNGLNGRFSLNMQNGILHGVDIRHAFTMADALIRQKVPTDTKGGNQTSFGSLRANFSAHNNVLNNNDFKIQAQDFYANGAGTINLNQQRIDYKLKARRHKDNENNLPLAIKVYGPLSNPTIQPDVDEYVKAILEQQIKNTLKDEANKLLDKNKLDDKIGNEIDKNLKKLFKF